ncbi:hypothetical protein NPX13_g6257 [Xylaria arbuscula]|uniref:C2H2-type domain-containing protein n=1 Tax=Xylaria arbuscula TaxID=114810 RepID=A0A9W8TKJ7_9PEZI|nr:hypothetical protein NPX13_g6257 [Xylaria arbuscula]
MTNVRNMVAAELSASNEDTLDLALTKMNFGFPLVKYNPWGHNNAEEDSTHRTACKPGGLFEPVLDLSEDLSAGFEWRAPEISQAHANRRLSADGGSLSSVPSLAHSRSTLNSLSIDFPPIRTERKLVDLGSPCQHSFKGVQARDSMESPVCQSCKNAEAEQSFLECTRCKTQECQTCYDKHYLREFAFNDVFLPPSPNLRPLLTEQSLLQLSIEDHETGASDINNGAVPLEDLQLWDLDDGVNLCTNVETREKSRIRERASLFLGIERHVIPVDPSESEKKETIEKLILDATKWLRLKFTETRDGIRESTAGSYASGNSSSVTSSQPSEVQAQSSRKRRSSDWNNDEGDNDDSDDISPHCSGSSDNKGEQEKTLRFACPYLKYNPTKYQRCRGPGWLDVHRVKEHLYRRHRQPKFRCMRCCECFESEQPCVDHQRTPVPCQLKDPEPIEGFDADQEKQLKSRKKKSHIVSEVDKWRAAFQILFPHVLADDIPSPFYESEQQSGPTTPSHEALTTEIEGYVLREFPSRLEQSLAAEFDNSFRTGEPNTRARVVEITKTILADLFHEYRKQSSRQEGESTTAQEFRGSHDSVGSSIRQAQSPWTDSIRFLDHMNLACSLSLDSESMAIFESVHLQDNTAASVLLENNVREFSDSRYASNIPAQFGEQANRPETNIEDYDSYGQYW